MRRIVRTVEDHPPLRAWLYNNEALLVWSHDGDDHTPTVQAWRIGSGIAYVILHPTFAGGSRGGGWDVATAPNTNTIEVTFRDAAQRVGLATESAFAEQQDENLGR